MHFPLLLNNKKSVVIPDKKGIVGSGYFKRHHMIGYSIVSDNAHTPGPSNCIYISKTNRKLSISYIPILRHYRKKKIRNKSLECPTHSRRTFRYYNSHFTNTYFATEFMSVQKVNVIPYPSTLNCKLSIRTAISDQLTKTDVGVRTFLRN